MSDVSLEAEESLYEQESDSDQEPDEDYNSTLPILSAIDYVNGAKSIIYDNENITNQNALAINQHLQDHLREMKRKLETLLQNVREKYKTNERLRERLIDDSVALKKDLICTSFFFCGKPYFKQMDLFSAPPNADYLYRKNTKNEYFPIDHLDTFKPWSAKDKLFLINGVKEQLLKFLMSSQRDAARNVKSNTIQGAKTRKSILDDRSLQRKKLHELFELAKDSTFVIDWFTISTRDLDDRHSTLECIGIWMNNLIPHLNRTKWTDKDDEKLMGIADEYNCQNWNQIGKHLNGRSGYDCITRYQGLISDHNVLKNCRWTKQEDDVLTEAVEKCRIGSFIPWSKEPTNYPCDPKCKFITAVVRNVAGVCDLIDDEDHTSDAAAIAAVIVYLIDELGEDGQCIDIDYEEAIEEERKIEWDDILPAFGLRQWTYQVCSELGWYHSSASRFQPYGSSFPSDFRHQACGDIFDFYSRETAVANINRFNSIRGGLNPGSTNVIYTHGQLDPTRTVGVQPTFHESSPVIVISGASQGNDLGPSDEEEDSDALTEARETIRYRIYNYIREAQRDIVVPI